MNNGRNAEHYEVNKSILGEISEAFATKYQLAPTRKAYADKFKIEDEAYLISRANYNTADVDAADKLNDGYFSTFKTSVKGFLNWPVAEKSAAARRVDFLINGYRDAYRRPLLENRAMIENLIQELRSEKYSADVTLLGLDDIVGLLESSNNDCRAKIAARASDTLAQEAADKLKTIRPEVDAAAQLLFDAINAIYMVYGLIEKDAAKEAEIGAVIDGVNKHLLLYSSTLSRRGAGTKAKVKPGSDLPSDLEDPDDPAPTPVG